MARFEIVLTDSDEAQIETVVNSFDALDDLLSEALLTGERVAIKGAKASVTLHNNAGILGALAAVRRTGPEGFAAMTARLGVEEFHDFASKHVLTMIAMQS